MLLFTEVTEAKPGGLNREGIAHLSGKNQHGDAVLIRPQYPCDGIRAPWATCDTDDSGFSFDSCVAFCGHSNRLFMVMMNIFEMLRRAKRIIQVHRTAANDRKDRIKSTHCQKICYVVRNTLLSHILTIPLFL